MKAQTRSLSARRWSVAVMYGSALFVGLILTQVGTLHERAIAMTVVALIAACFAALVILFRGTTYWHWGNAPDTGLDEYQVTTRNRAYLNAYRGLATLGLLALLAARIGGDFGLWGRITDLQKEFLFWTYFLVILTLPASILAWTDRPLPDE